MSSPPWISVTQLWDDSSHTARRRRHGVHLKIVRNPIRIYLAKRERTRWKEIGCREYEPLGLPGRRNTAALQLFRNYRSLLRKPVVITGSPYFSAPDLLYNIRATNSAVAASVPPRVVQEMLCCEDWSILASLEWYENDSTCGAFLQSISLDKLDGLLYVFDSERIASPRRGTKFLAYFGPDTSIDQLALLLRRRTPVLGLKTNSIKSPPSDKTLSIQIPVQRPNLSVAIRQDSQFKGSRNIDRDIDTGSRGAIGFVDLFAGAGGLALGFLSARNAEYELCAALDISNICAATLRGNLLGKRRPNGITGSVAADAIWVADLGKQEALCRLGKKFHGRQEVQVLVGGPPCQPFSSARRRPGGQAEASLVECFRLGIEALQPSVFVMENVQGILWKDASGRRPLEKFALALTAAGYRISARVLDAAWFGAAQHRSRAVIVGLHPRISKDLDPEDAFPSPERTGSEYNPYRTVADAIGDLPEIPNGHGLLEMANVPVGSDRSEAPCTPILDHITSRHSEYVLARFEKIPPGRNWTAIRHMMSNYSNKEGTHSNIYRRLEWDKPSVTLGHYRKAMIIHPGQARGLSLREAMRLQSFPDWYRIWGHERSLETGLERKQQQLANAVPPVLAQALAERIANVITRG